GRPVPLVLARVAARAGGGERAVGRRAPRDRGLVGRPRSRGRARRAALDRGGAGCALAGEDAPRLGALPHAGRSRRLDTRGGRLTAATSEAIRWVGVSSVS